MHSPPAPAELIEDVGHRLGDHHVARGHGQPMAQRAMAGERGPGRQHHRAGANPPGAGRRGRGSPPSRRGGLGARALEDPTRPAPAASTEARAPASPDGRWPRRDRRPRRETGASRSEPATSASVSGRHTSGTPSSLARGGHLAPGVVVGGGGRDLEVSGPAKPGVDALLLAPPADARHRLAGGARDLERGRVAESSPKGRKAEPHLVHEAAVTPARPRPAALGLDQHDPRLRLQLRHEPCGPHARVAAPDDRHVGVDVAVERRPG